MPHRRTLHAAAAATRRGSAHALNRHGMFVDARMERAYQQAVLAVTRSRLRLFGLLGGAVFLLAALLDAAVLRDRVLLGELFGIRLGIFGLGLLLAYLARPTARSGLDTLRRALIAFELAVVLGLSVITLNYHGAAAYRVVPLLAVTLAFYAYLPPLTRANLWLLPMLGAAYLAEVDLAYQLSPRSMAMVALLVLLANLAGWQLAVRDGRARRQAWMARRRVRREVRERRGAERSLRRLLEVCPVPLVVNKARGGDVLLANRAARLLFNPGRSQLAYRQANASWFFVRRQEQRAMLGALRSRGLVRSADVRLRTVDGAPIDVMLAARCLRYDGQPAVISSLVEITARKRYEQELHRLSETDPLTGLRNRRGFFLDAEAMLDRAAARPLSLLLMDVDRFKSINDSRGHGVGDLVLQMLAGRVRAALRAHDVLARIGGEEFAVLMPHTDLDDACVVAERIREAVGRHAMRIHGQRLPVTLSIGVSLVGQGRMAIDNALSRADAAMYRAKEGGRDRVEAQAA